MSGHNLYRDLGDERTDLPPAGKALYIPDLNGYLVAWGPTVPTDGATGYAKGCTFHHTDASGNTDVLYVNIGSGTSCNFNAATVAAD